MKDNITTTILKKGGRRWGLLDSQDRAYVSAGRIFRALLRQFAGSKKTLIDKNILDLFDADWYRATYADAALSGADAEAHYIESGYSEGRSPNAYMDPAWYLDNNPDVRANGMSPIRHYAVYGWREGRNPSLDFDVTAYLRVHDDVRELQIDPLAHFIKHGRQENRAIFRAVSARDNRQPQLEKPKRSTSHTSDFFLSDIVDDRLLQFLSRIGLLIGKNRPVSAIFALPLFGRGGSEKVALSFADIFVRTHPEQSVLLLVTDQAKIDRTIDIPSGVYVIDFSAFAHGLNFELRARLLLKIIAALRPQIFHIINSDLAWSMLVKNGPFLSGITRVFGSIFCVQRNYDTGELIGFASSYFDIACKYCHMVLTDNHFFAREAIELFPRSEASAPLVPIYNPATWPRSVRDFPLLSRKPRETSQPPSVLWAGRLDRQKRVELVFEVARLLPSVLFFVYGASVTDGQYKIETLPNVKMCGGFSSFSQLIETRSYDAYIHTTYEEGLPNILLEVGMAGIPIIAPAIGGIPELIYEETGHLIPATAGASEYAAAIERVVSMPDESDKCSRRLGEIIQNRHSWSQFEEAVQMIQGYL